MRRNSEESLVIMVGNTSSTLIDEGASHVCYLLRIILLCATMGAVLITFMSAIE